MLYTFYDNILRIELFSANLNKTPQKGEEFSNGININIINDIQGNKVYITKIN